MKKVILKGMWRGKGRVQETAYLSALDQWMVLPFAGTGKPARIADLGTIVSSMDW